MEEDKTDLEINVYEALKVNWQVQERSCEIYKERVKTELDKNFLSLHDEPQCLVMTADDNDESKSC